MAVRRASRSVLIFGAGVLSGVGVWQFRSGRPVEASEAQRRALQILAKTPITAGADDNPIVQAVRRISPTVVNIDTVGHNRNEEEPGLAWRLNPEVRGKGSGVILSPDGYIITNSHVIEGARSIRVTFPSGNWMYARLIGRDEQTDLALVRVEATDLKYAELGDSDRLQVGEWSIAVGNPLGLGSTVTVGVISALNRRNLQVDESHNLDGAIQTDAAINRGNSGGALANTQGQLIGINTAILSASPNGGNIGLGFAIPSNAVRDVVRRLLLQTRPAAKRASGRPWLGITYTAVPEDLGQVLKLTPDRGVLLYKVQPESPAALAGIEEGDVLLAIDRIPVRGVGSVSQAVLRRRVGETVVFHILRPGDRSRLEISLLLRERPSSASGTQ